MRSLKALGVSAMALGMGVMATPAFAQVFPVDVGSQTTITSVQADIVAWGVALLSLSLALLAYRRVKSVAR
ncbi:MAG: hypothetical protein OEY86_14825 [Nitrospira sp.]|nr:hypothetical protein [Nitrospira sp.]